MVKYFDIKRITDSFEPELSQEVMRIVGSGWYLLGKEVEQFETAFAGYCGVDYCIGVANGLDALTLILRAWMEMGEIKTGDQVIVPSNTYIASILAVSRCGLEPVLCEPSEETLLIDETLIESLITSRTRVIMPVHLYGRLCEMDEINRIASKYGLKVLEDCAQSQGAIYKGKRAGNLCDAAAFSFYPAKNIGALGDAGAVTTNDKELAELVRILANYGSGKKYVFNYKGVNSRLDELHAAVICLKLKRLDDDNDRRRVVARQYLAGIDNPLIILPTVSDWNAHVFHVFPVMCESRDVLQQYLKEQGIETLIHYPIPPHKQYAYREWNERSYPISESIHKDILSLPVSQVLTDEEVQEVIEAVNHFCLC